MRACCIFCSCMVNKDINLCSEFETVQDVINAAVADLEPQAASAGKSAGPAGKSVAPVSPSKSHRFSAAVEQAEESRLDGMRRSQRIANKEPEASQYVEQNQMDEETMPEEVHGSNSEEEDRPDPYNMDNRVQLIFSSEVEWVKSAAFRLDLSALVKGAGALGNCGVRFSELMHTIYGANQLDITGAAIMCAFLLKPKKSKRLYAFISGSADCLVRGAAYKMATECFVDVVQV